MIPPGANIYFDKATNPTGRRFSGYPVTGSKYSKLTKQSRRIIFTALVLEPVN